MVKAQIMRPRNSKTIARFGDPKLLDDAMKSYQVAKDANNRDCALEGSKLFGFTKQNLTCHIRFIAILIDSTK